MPQFKNAFEIDHHTLKFIVGVIAISLANVTAFFSDSPLDSISASYHEGGWARDIFVGFLFAICAFLLAYNGASRWEMVLSKVAALAAAGVAMFPCGCDGHPEIIPMVHGISAGVMFMALAVFCAFFYARARNKAKNQGPRQANWRAFIYAACGVVILASIGVLAYDYVTDKSISTSVTRLTFYGERAGLMAFGIAWLVASRAIPIITRKDERIPLL
jgi:hypothetical protein